MENETNIEARGVRKILLEDAFVLVNLLHRDFKRRKFTSVYKPSFHIPPEDAQPLKHCIYKVGRQENAVKAVLMHELRHNSSFVSETFSNTSVSAGNIDSVNEFFVAQTTRKSIDVYCVCRNHHILFEVKTDIVRRGSLHQVLYYRDLLLQRPWMDGTRDTVSVVLLGKRFEDDIIKIVKSLSQVSNSIRLLQYVPENDSKWARFQYVI